MASRSSEARLLRGCCTKPMAFGNRKKRHTMPLVDEPVLVPLWIKLVSDFAFAALALPLRPRYDGC